MSTISTSYAKCNSLPTSIGWIVNHQLVEYQDEDLIFLCHHTYSLVKACVKSLIAHAFKGNQFHLAKSNACEMLESKCDRVIIKELGEGAGLHSSTNKKSGSLVEAVISQLEIDLKKYKRNNLDSLAEVIDLFAGSKVYEFYTKFIPSFVTTQNDKKPEEKVKIVADLMQVFLQTWSALLRASPLQKLSTDSNSEFLDILFGNSFEVIASISHVTWMARKGHCNKMVNDVRTMVAEQAMKFNALRTRLETFLFTQFGNQGPNGNSGKDACKYSGNYDWKSPDDAVSYDSSVRVCRAVTLSSCAESIIDDKDKYVQFRCDQGCISSLHKSCFQSLQGRLEADGAGRLKCINSILVSAENQEEFKTVQSKRCEGLVFGILLNKGSKVLAIAAGSENFNPSDSGIHQEGFIAVDSAEADCVCSLEVRDAIKTHSKIRPLKYVLLKQLQSEKEQAEMKKKQAAEILQTAVEEKKDAEDKSAASSSVSPKKSKKPFAIEVVLPLVKSNPAPAPAPTSASSFSSSSSSTPSSSISSSFSSFAAAVSVSSVPSAIASKHTKSSSSTPSNVSSLVIPTSVETDKKSNGCSGLNVKAPALTKKDEDEWQSVPIKSKRNAAGNLNSYNYVSSAVASATSSSSSPSSFSSESLFPATLKHSKKKASGSKGKTFSQLSAAEQKAIDEAIVRSLQDADHDKYVSNVKSSGVPQALPIPAPHEVKSQSQQNGSTKRTPAALDPPTASNSIASQLFPTKRVASHQSKIDFPSLPTTSSSVSSCSSLSASVNINSSSSSAFKAVQKMASFSSPFTSALIQSAASASNSQNLSPSSVSVCSIVASDSAEGIAHRSSEEGHSRQEGESEPGSDSLCATSIPGGCVEGNHTSLNGKEQEELKSEAVPRVDTSVASVASSSIGSATSPVLSVPTSVTSSPMSSTSSVPTSSVSPSLSSNAITNSSVVNDADSAVSGSAKLPPSMDNSNQQLTLSTSTPPIPSLANSIPATFSPFPPITSFNSNTSMQPGAPAPAATTGTQLQLVQSVATSLNNVQTPVLVVRHLPLSILPQQLGALFVQYGKVNVRLFLESDQQSNHSGHSLSHLTAVLSYQCIEHAANAFQQLSNKTFEIDSSDGDMDYFQMQIQFGCFPLDILKMPQSKFRLVQ